MAQARAVAERCGLLLLEDNAGVFQNQTMQEIHDRLLARGLRSDKDSLEVAATFEEVSVVDLEMELAAAQAEDVKAAYQGLLAGSRKHLRSYVSDLRDQGIEYQPMYLVSSQFQEIMSVE